MRLDDPALEEMLVRALPRQRWFASKGRTISGVGLATCGPTTVATVEFVSGPDERYVLPLAELTRTTVHEAERPEVLGALPDGTLVVDALRAPETGAADAITVALGAAGPVSVLDGEQSNTSLRVGSSLVKVFRRLSAEPNPEAEMGAHLAAQGFTHTAAFRGSVDLPTGETLAVAHRFVPNARDAWTTAITANDDETTALARALGAATAELHAVLSRPTDDPAFAPEQASPAWLAALAFGICVEVAEVAALQELDLEPSANGARIRTHGDLHLGQVLWTGTDALIIDFEGEPSRPVAERRQKHLAERDLAGVVRSFDYAAHTRTDREPETWGRSLAAAFLAAYRDAGGRVDERALRLYLLEKAAYEVGYEEAHRPDWAPIPMAGLRSLLADHNSL